MCKIAFFCFKCKKYSAAISIYKLLSKQIDKYADARFYLGLAYFATNDYNEAKSNFLKFSQTNPASREALYNIGLVYLQTKNTPAAKEYFQKTLEMDEKHIDSLYQLGLTAFEERDITAAYGYFTMAKKLAPDNIDFKYCLLRCEDLLCQYTTREEADEIINKYEELLPKKKLLADFYIESAYIYSLAKAGKTEEAVSKATAFLTTAANQKHILHKILGLCYFVKQDYTNALSNFSEALNHCAPNDKIKLNKIISYYYYFHNNMEQFNYYQKTAQNTGENLYTEEDLYLI